ncbi:hypothetical protein [Streptomyces sp. DSM 41013]
METNDRDARFDLGPAERELELVDPEQNLLAEILAEDLEDAAREAERGSTQESAEDAVLRNEGTEDRP